MFLHPARVRPVGKPLELYFHRMLPSKGSALVRCRCIFVFTTLDNLFAFFFYLRLCAVFCAPVTHRYLCVYLVLYLFLSHFHALFTCLCYQWVLQSLKVWFWNLSSLLRLIPRRRRKKTSYNDGRAQPLLEIKCIYGTTLDEFQDYYSPSIRIRASLKKSWRQLYTFVTILLNAAIMLQPKTFQRILL